MNHRSIVHRDLNPENILFEKLKNGFEIFKINDFSVGKNNQQQNSWTDTLNGLTTPAYMAPETIALNLDNSKVDMWAIGIVVYQLLSKGKLPFEADNYYNTMK